MIKIISSSNSKADFPTVLEVSGRLDSQASIALLGSVQRLIEEDKHQIIIDFDKLEIVSSEGLAALVQSKSQLTKLNGALRLANLHGRALEVFHLVHFDRLFDLHLNIEEAVEQFAMYRKNTCEEQDEGVHGD